MKVDEMERLLAAYYEGTTDEHEENRLKEALRTEDVSEHLEADRRLLAALEEESPQEVSVPEGLEEKLSRLIDRKDEELPHFLRPNRTRRNWRWAAGVAATFLVLMGIGWGRGHDGEETCATHAARHLQRPAGRLSRATGYVQRDVEQLEGRHRADAGSAVADGCGTKGSETRIIQIKKRRLL